MKLPWRTILLTWLLVGTLDIISATIYFLARGNSDPVNILVYISSAIYGPRAAEIGAPSMAILGLALHYLIAFIWTTLFFILYELIPGIISKNRIITAYVYAFLMQLVMSQVVVKYSNTAKRPFSLDGFAINGLILFVAIGLPLSYIAYRHYNTSKPQ